MLRDLVCDIAKALVDHPEAVQVEERYEGEYLHLELRVAPDDMGKIIGRGGKIARAIRSVVKAASLRENQKVLVDIL